MHIYSPLVAHMTKFFAIVGHKALIQMHYEWLYNLTIEQTSIGYIIVMLGNVIKVLK